ncbi:hypothetical protein [Adlercreutzia agrestimuris]|uniref:hypothetical protein n=1 Tax=Adlercreutzia agrestimuris TaxID=2941324 RepID=UPI002041D778|nr:hypothetical protein [Adlercreutzia agrestimuris]
MRSSKISIMSFATLCFALILGVGQAYAVDAMDAEKEEALSNSATLLRLVETDQDYQDLYNMPKVDFDNLQLGDSFCVFTTNENVLNDTGIRVWPVMFDSTVVGATTSVLCGDGSRCYSYSTEYAAILNKAIADPDSWHFATVDEQEIACSFGSIVVLDSSQESKNPSEDLLSMLPDNKSRQSALLGDYANKDVSSICVEELDTTPARAAATMSKTLALPKFYQGTKPQCMANAINSIGKYLTGISYNIDWLDSHYTIIHNFPQAVKAFAAYNYPSSSTTIHSTLRSGAIPNSDIKRWIDNGIPILARFAAYDGSAGHAVAVRGYGASGSTFAISVMDPAKGDMVSIVCTSTGVLAYQRNGTVYAWQNGHTIVLDQWQQPYGQSRGYIEWAYYDLLGARATGWKSLGGNWYRFSNSGIMLTGWQKIGYYWYYMNSSGVMQTGWQKINGYWYYLNSEGEMQTGWYKENGSWYYLRPATNTPGTGPEGSMLHSGTWTINGKAYRFDSSGVCLNP